MGGRTRRAVHGTTGSGRSSAASASSARQASGRRRRSQRARPAPSDVTEGRFRALLRNYGAFHKEHSAPDSPYAGQGYARPQQVKRRYDPGDVFRHAQSVRLPDAG
ncbi:BBE domain-containing protein [Streptomyces sp. NPDC004609]|uniref:BBE domain-containing protein n=1 Tax=Streptomyces sp. NPDC004609 TaxID=3364704 RepID=UPI00367C489F